MSDLIRQRREIWAAALRSGRYKQGYGRLRNYSPDGDDTYCCLGVACEVYRDITGKSDWGYDSRRGYFFEQNEKHGQRQEVVLPREVSEFFDVTASGILRRPRKTSRGDAGGLIIIHSLMDANDSQVDFSQIADIVDKDDLLLSRGESSD